VHSNSIKEQIDPSPNGDGACAPSGQSLRQIIWDAGLKYLRSVYRESMAEVTLRSRLGMMIQTYGEGPVLDAMAKTQRAEPFDPLSYMQRILQKTMPGSTGKPAEQLPAWKAEINDKLARMRAANK